MIDQLVAQRTVPLLPYTAAALDRRTRETPAQRSKFARVRHARVEYERKLRRVARTVGAITRGLAEGAPLDNVAAVQEALRRYARIVEGWARRAAASMLADVMRRDEAAWAAVSRNMSRALADEVRHAPTGEVTRQLLEEQVELITSLPLEAAARVHEIAMRAMETGARADELAEQIMATGHVTASRAALIARTETSRSSSVLLQARATHVGSEGYIWRTSEDADVRPLHKKLSGQFIRWDEPPVSGSSGERAHAGQIYNCRCWAEPVIPEFNAEAA